MDNKSDLWGIVSLLKKVILGSFITTLLIVVGFLIYLVKVNKERQQVISATGMYNLVNSKTGEIINTDLTAEDIQKIMELLDGKN